VKDDENRNFLKMKDGGAAGAAAKCDSNLTSITLSRGGQKKPD
jgi:hypothetical protein